MTTPNTVCSTVRNPRTLKITLTDSTEGLSFSQHIHLGVGQPISHVGIWEAIEHLNQLLDLAIRSSDSWRRGYAAAKDEATKEPPGLI